MPKLNHNERRDHDIHEFVTKMLEKKFNGKTVHTYAFVLEKASERFYLTPERIANIFRNYVPPAQDPAQLDIFEQVQPKTDTPSKTP